LANIFNAPYLTNKKLTFFKQEDLTKKLRSIQITQSSAQMENLSLLEVNRLISLYTSAGFLNEYKRTGRFSLPYSSDYPLAPDFVVIKNTEYYYYQKLLLDLQNEKTLLVKEDTKSILRKLYSFFKL